jgi:AraC family transcriptional regulator
MKNSNRGDTKNISGTVKIMENYQPSQSAVHPFEITKDEWILSRKFIHSGKIVIEHDIQPPDEFESPPLNHHILVFNLNNYSPRQVHQFAGKEYDGQLRKGDFFLLPAGIPAFFHWESTDEALVLMISPDFLHQIAIETDYINPDKIELSPVILSNDPQLESIALSLKSEMIQDGIGGLLYIESLTNILGIHLLRNYCCFKSSAQEYKDGLSKYKLKEILEYINAHIDEEISLIALAKLAEISQYYFCQLFKQSMGISPYQYVIQQRVERAKLLLKFGDVAICDVALASGFANQSHLTKHFRKLTGVTPKVYRLG